MSDEETTPGRCKECGSLTSKLNGGVCKPCDDKFWNSFFEEVDKSCDQDSIIVKGINKLLKLLGISKKQKPSDTKGDHHG